MKNNSIPEAPEAVNMDVVDSASALTVPRWMVLLLVQGARHWLTLLAALTLFYVGLSFLAPVAMHQGREELARRIYHLYSFTCHQLPTSSFWLFGTDKPFRARLDDVSVGAADMAAREYVGSPAVGFKSGMCWRTLAIYGSVAVFLMAYLGMRRSWRALSLWAGLILVLPMAADGISQMLGLRESNVSLRLLTGLLFGLGITWTLVPRMDAAMRDVVAELQGR